MHLQEAIALIENAQINKFLPTTWADLGCGTGIFTQALASIIHPNSQIYAVDQSVQAIQPIKSVRLKFLRANFEKDPLSLPPLDGILMANSLHFVSDKRKFLEKLKVGLSDDGSFIIVEYDTNESNPWVPYPIDFISLKKLFLDAGFNNVDKIGQRKSSYGNKMMYACEVQWR